MARPAMLRVFEREVLVHRRQWRGLFFSSLVAPALYLLAMGVGLGDLIDHHSGPIDSLRYLEFIAPGLLVASVVQVTTGESLWPILGGFKWIRHYHGMASSPITPRAVFWGELLWGATRDFLMAVGFIVVAALLGAVPSAWGVFAIPAAVLTGTAFCAPLSAFASSQDDDAVFPLIFRLGMAPMFFFSGTFFPVENLPDGVQPLIWLSPVWHGVELARGATSGTFDGPAIVGHVVVLVAIIAAGSWWGLRSYERRLAS